MNTNKIRKISPSNRQLNYCGRIDWEQKEAPLWMFPSTCLSFACVAKKVEIVITNHSLYFDNYLGVIVNGIEKSILLKNTGEKEIIVLAESLDETECQILVFKRQDTCHYLRIHEIRLHGEAKLVEWSPKWMQTNRRIEVYGDSVSAGEVSEAMGYEGKEDPLHQGEYSNAYWSYAFVLARLLDARIHNISQGGIALMDRSGYFLEPNYLGMESVYDKLSINPVLKEMKKWDFDAYTPQVVLVALGQNDNHPFDYMAHDIECESAKRWRKRYKSFVLGIREKYPRATIILMTTILEHSLKWDESIKRVCDLLKDPNIHYFAFSQTGCGTKGHIRVSEAVEMAQELYNYLQQLNLFRDCE